MRLREFLFFAPAWLAIYAFGRMAVYCGLRGINSEACLLTLLVWSNVFLSSMVALLMLRVIQARVRVDCGLVCQIFWSGMEVIFFVMWMRYFWEVVSLVGGMSYGAVTLVAWFPAFLIVTERIILLFCCFKKRGEL